MRLQLPAIGLWSPREFWREILPSRTRISIACLETSYPCMVETPVLWLKMRMGPISSYIRIPCPPLELFQRIRRYGFIEGDILQGWALRVQKPTSFLVCLSVSGCLCLSLSVSLPPICEWDVGSKLLLQHLDCLSPCFLSGWLWTHSPQPNTSSQLSAFFCKFSRLWCLFTAVEK